MDDIIVVEGLHDVSRIKELYPLANCVITNGCEVSKETLDLIKKLSETHNIIIFTDPDSPGEKIRKMVTEVVPNAKQAFIRKKDSISKNNKKVGVEHADLNVIKESLENVYSYNENTKENITNIDLYELGLNGDSNSAILRNKISDILNIGKPNSKTFLKRLNLIGISKEELQELLCKIK
ncbi:MAG: ribonuclease M5 [Acholeplasmatales bacterium]|nr:ribonuclease M5 [Acholeplasmatales bacterium]